MPVTAIRTAGALAAALSLCLLAAVAQALTPLSAVRYSPDITVTFGGTNVDDENVADDNLAGAVSLVDVGAIPADTAITAYHRLANGDQLLSFGTPVTLPGGLMASTGDIVVYDGSGHTLLFDAAAHGIAGGVIVDALGALSSGDLIVSFDVTVAISGFTADDEDLVRFQGNNASLFFRGAIAGIAPELDLDAFDCIDHNAHMLVSFDGSGQVGGVVFDDEDVLELSPESGTWEMAYDGSTKQADWAGADLDAFFSVAANVAAPAAPHLEGGPTDDGGVHVGSNRVFGTGTPHAKTGDMCIAVYEVGSNGVRDNPAGSVDDELLGVGGTNAQGELVDTNEVLGIGLSRPLVPEDEIFLVDVCEDLSSALLAVPVPTPALDLAAIGVLCLILTLVATVGLSRSARSPV